MRDGSGIIGHVGGLELADARASRDAWHDWLYGEGAGRGTDARKRKTAMQSPDIALADAAPVPNDARNQIADPGSGDRARHPAGRPHREAPARAQGPADPYRCAAHSRSGDPL